MKKGVDYPGVTIVFCCHDGQGNFVMARRSQNTKDEQGRWDIGGGGLELGDTVTSRLEKEISEEYCTRVLGFEFLGYRDVHRQNGNERTHWIALDFKVLVERSTVAIGERHKFEEIGWFTLGTIPENLHSQLPLFFEKYKDKLWSNTTS